MRSIYAIGDIHGRLDLLDEMLDSIKRHASGRGECAAVFLGDYIDRGPDSKGVIARLMAGPLPFETICLAGNHEDLAVNGPEYVWLLNGGDKTLASYGGAIDPEHLKWMRALPTHYRDGRWFFVHAGVNPNRPLERQERQDMLWIRAKFLLYTEPYDGGATTVVHGHTPGDEVEIEANRINLDTGAVFGGPLSCAVLRGDILENIIQVTA